MDEIEKIKITLASMELIGNERFEQLIDLFKFYSEKQEDSLEIFAANINKRLNRIENRLTALENRVLNLENRLKNLENK